MAEPLVSNACVASCVHPLLKAAGTNCTGATLLSTAVHPYMFPLLLHPPTPPPSLYPAKKMSNFDERLHPLLKNLGVYDSFDFVLTSRYNSEKSKQSKSKGLPKPMVFDRACMWGL